MKFIVTKSPRTYNSETVEVELHPDTKYWLCYYGVLVGTASIVWKKHEEIADALAKMTTIKK